MISISLNLLFTGLIFGSGPCLASCGPVLISYFAGAGKKPAAALWGYALFSLARITMYLALSLLVYSAGGLILDKYLPGVARYALLFSGLGIAGLGMLVMLGSNSKFKPLCALHGALVRRDAATMILAGLSMGLLPCAPLLGILSYIGLVAKSLNQSLALSLMFGLGTFFSPLLLLAPASGLLRKLIQTENQAKFLRIICGLIIVVMGMQLLFRSVFNAESLCS